MGPQGSITFNLIPELSSLFVEVVLIAGVVGFLEDRRWFAVRKLIRRHFDDEVEVFAGCVASISKLREDMDLGRRTHYKRALSRELKEFQRFLASDELSDHLQFLTPGLTPKLAAIAGDYIDARKRLKFCLACLQEDNSNHAELFFYFLSPGPEQTPEEIAVIDSATIHYARNAKLHIGKMLRLADELGSAEVRLVSSEHQIDLKKYYGPDPRLEAAERLSREREIAEAPDEG